MSFDTYFSVVITSIVAIIVGLLTVLFPIIFSGNTVENQEKNKKGKNYRELIEINKMIIAFACLGVLLFLGTTIIYQMQKSNKYNNAKSIEYNIEVKVIVLSYESNCYLQLGLSSYDDNYLFQAKNRTMEKSKELLIKVDIFLDAYGN